MSLDAYALTTIEAARSYIGTEPRADALWIYCASPEGATAATAQISDSALTLIITGGDSQGTEPLSLGGVDTNTLSELVEAINDLTGWSAGLIYHGSADSGDLLVTGALKCLGSENEITLKISDDYLITQLINSSSCLIERYCNRKLVSRTYSREVYDGNGHNKLILRQYPVTRVTRLSIGRKNAFYVKCSATTYAFVEVNSTQVLLNKDGTTTTLTIADYATLVLLIAAINETSGWTATIVSTDYNAYKSSEILSMPALYCKSPDIAYVEMIDEDASDFSVLNIGDEFTNAGIIYYPAGFPEGAGSVRVDYLAGYTTIPYALEQACLELVKYKYDKSKREAGVSSMTLGDFSFTIADFKNALPADLVQALDLFKRRVL